MRKTKLFTTIFTVLMMSFTLLAQTKRVPIAKTISFSATQSDYSKVLSDLIAEDKYDTIKFESDKIYKFEKGIQLTGTKLKRIESTGQNKATLLMSKGNGTFMTHHRKVNFKNLIFDNGDNGQQYGTFFNLNNVGGVQFNACNFLNSKSIAISAGKGYNRFCNGLQVFDCKFKNIKGISVLNLIDRRTNARDTDGEFTEFGKKTPVIKFTLPVKVVRCRFERYDVAIRMDCGNDFYKLKATDVGVRRYEETTNVNLTVKDCTFLKAKRWNIGAVQARNLKFIGNNKFYGGGAVFNEGDKVIGSPACFHLEQFTRDITIKGAKFFIDAGYGIQAAGKEGYKRHKEVVNAAGKPILTIFDNKGGREHTTAAGSPSVTCEGLLCKKAYHRYGPKNFKIQGSTFNSLTDNVLTAITFGDSENFVIGDENETLKNNYNGTFSRGKIVVSKGDKGNVNLVINDNLDVCDIYLKVDEGDRVEFASKLLNFKLNGKNYNSYTCLKTSIANTNKSKLEFEEATSGYEILMYPNPVVNGQLNIGLVVHNATIAVYDLLGNKVKSFKVLKNTTIQVSFSDVDSGMYILRSTGENGSSVVKRLIVK